MMKLGVRLSVVLLSLLQLQVATAIQVRVPMGQIYYLPKTNLLGAELLGGATVVVLNNTECFICEKSEIVEDNSVFFKDTEAFYSSVQEESKLGAELKADFTLGFTLDQTSVGISSAKREITGSTINVYSKVGHCVAKPECIYDNSFNSIDSRFTEEFEKLPRSVDYVRGELDFHAYDVYLNRFGSHVVTGITYGSRMYQHCISSSEENYDERQLTVRACIAFAGSTDVTKTNISTCAGISEKEASNTTSYKVTTRLVLRGGTNETRSQLATSRTDELVAKFLEEASLEEPIEYEFTALWSILGQKYMGTEHYAKVRNLEGYYLGKLNYNCTRIMAHRPDGTGVEMQGFGRKTGGDVPSYKCAIPYEGCHDPSDCHYGPGVYCTCKGYTCFKDVYTTLNTGVRKLGVEANWAKYWKWQGCHLGVFDCDCKNSQRWDWRTVWDQDKDGADNGKMTNYMHQKINAAAEAAKSKKKRNKQEL